MSETLILGGGVLGSAIAWVAADGGARVTVYSRTPRALPALWRRYDDGPLPARGASVFLAVAPVDDPDTHWSRTVPELANAAWTAGARAVTVCVPAGDLRLDPADLRRGGPAGLLRVAPLLAVDEGCAAPWIRALRSNHAARIPHGLPAVWPLVAEDAARAAWRLQASGETHSLRGTERMDAAELAGLFAERFGGRWTERWFGGIERWRRDLLAAATTMDDTWDDARFGPRTPVRVWVDRLAGRRPRR